MSVQAMTAVLDFQPDWDWSSAEKFVLLSIANHANRYGDDAFPGWDTIAEETCLSPSTVARAVRALKHRKILSSRRSTEQGRFGLTVYSINLPSLRPSPSATVTDEPDTTVTDGPTVTTTDGPDVTVAGGPSVTPSVIPSVTDVVRNQGTLEPPARRDGEPLGAWLERTAAAYSGTALGTPVDDPASPCYSGVHDFRSDGTGYAACRVCELRVPVGLAEVAS